MAQPAAFPVQDVQLVSSEDKGCFVQAKRSYQPGQVVWAEKPLASVLNHDQQRCQHCWRAFAKGKSNRCSACKAVRYCSRECQKAAWKLHKPECKTIKGLPPNPELLRSPTLWLMCKLLWYQELCMAKDGGESLPVSSEEGSHQLLVPPKQPSLGYLRRFHDLVHNLEKHSPAKKTQYAPMTAIVASLFLQSPLKTGSALASAPPADTYGTTNIKSSNNNNNNDKEHAAVAAGSDSGVPAHFQGPYTLNKDGKATPAAAPALDDLDGNAAAALNQLRLAAEQEEAGDGGDNAAEERAKRAAAAAFNWQLFSWFGRLNCNLITITEEEGATVGLGLYPWLARVNHSCNPNCVLAFEGNVARLRVIAPVKKGDELSISYIELAQTCSERREELREQYMFLCRCPRCVAGSSPLAEAASAPERELCGLVCGSCRTLLAHRADDESNLLHCTNPKCDDAGGPGAKGCEALRKGAEEARQAINVARQLPTPEAIALLERTHKAFAKIGHKNHLYNFRMLAELGRLQMEAQDYNAACRFYELAVPLMDAVYPTFHSLKGLQMLAIGKMRWFLEDTRGCINATERARALLVVSHGRDHPLVSGCNQLIHQASQLLQQEAVEAQMLKDA